MTAKHRIDFNADDTAVRLKALDERPFRVVEMGLDGRQRKAHHG